MNSCWGFGKIGDFQELNSPWDAPRRICCVMNLKKNGYPNNMYLMTHTETTRHCKQSNTRQETGKLRPHQISDSLSLSWDHFLFRRCIYHPYWLARPDEFNDASSMLHHSPQAPNQGEWSSIVSPWKYFKNRTTLRKDLPEAWSCAWIFMESL